MENFNKNEIIDLKKEDKKLPDITNLSWPEIDKLLESGKLEFDYVDILNQIRSFKGEGLDENSKKEFIGGILEKMLVKSQKIDEGKEAVILEYIKKGKGLARVLKIFNSVDFFKEAELHEKAYQVVEEAIKENKDKKFARIPEIYLKKSLKINDDEVKNKLLKMGVKLSQDDKINLMVMDFIKGRDLFSYMLTELLEHYNISKDSAGKETKDIEQDDPQYHFKASRLIGVLSHFMSIKKDHPLADNNSKIATDIENRNEITRKLKEINFTIDKEIIDKLRNTINLLNENNIYHNDLHEVNIMFEMCDKSECEESEIPKVKEVYIIDFGRAQQVPDSNAFMDDISIINNLEEKFVKKDNEVDK